VVQVVAAEAEVGEAAAVEVVAAAAEVAAEAEVGEAAAVEVEAEEEAAAARLARSRTRCGCRPATSWTTSPRPDRS
jgi:hypothetical protein